jgi:N-acetylglucosaminyldiphosphoundecaprenol N-acetyl-beta-D-mannosaminyltransferase
LPAIVFVFLGCPKQEKWMATMKGKVNAVMTGVGGALPVTIGMQKRAPVWMRNFGLEWLYRFFQEPKRLFKRYATTNSLFIWVMLKEFLKVRILTPLKLAKA